MVEYKEPYTVSLDAKQEIIRIVRNNSNLKPWNLLAKNDIKHKDLKKMVLSYELTTNADGYIILPP